MPQAEPGSKIQFGRVLAHKANGAFNVGRPYLENITVEAEVLEELKGPKLIVRSATSPPSFPWCRACLWWRCAPLWPWQQRSNRAAVQLSANTTPPRPGGAVFAAVRGADSNPCAAPQVYKHKPKKHYQRKTGHRQPLTKFLVTKISPAADA